MDRNSNGTFAKGHENIGIPGRKKGAGGKFSSPFKKGMTPWNKGESFIFNCKECSKEFTRVGWEVRRGKTKFCSRICSNKGRECTKTFGKADKHPAWKNGLSLNLYPSEFNQTLKNKIRSRDNYTCVLCGITEHEHKNIFKRVLSVNHIDFNKNNCCEDNLNTLCTACNTRINWDRDRWTNYFNNIKK